MPNRSYVRVRLCYVGSIFIMRLSKYMRKKMKNTLCTILIIQYVGLVSRLMRSQAIHITSMPLMNYYIRWMICGVGFDVKWNGSQSSRGGFEVSSMLLSANRRIATRRRCDRRRMTSSSSAWRYFLVFPPDGAVI